MKNLIAELLVKLAQKEEESKELTAQVEALVTALLRHMEQGAQQALISDIEQAIDEASPGPLVDDRDTQLLQQYIKKLLRHPRS